MKWNGTEWNGTKWNEMNFWMIELLWLTWGLRWWCGWHDGATASVVEFFLHFQVEIELLLQSRAHLADLIFQKRSETRIFCTFSSRNWALATVLCTFCVQLSPIERATAETETLLGRPQQPVYPKKHRVSRPRMFSSSNSLVPDLLHFPTTWHDDWDDVVAMMVRKLTMTIVLHSNIF